MDDPSADDHGADLGSLVLTLIVSRHSVAPKRLQAPGPDPAQLLQMVDAAACAPDQRGLRPWRLLRIADHQRTALAGLFEACLRDRINPHDAPPSADDLAKSRDKAHCAPTLLLAVLNATPAEPEVPLTERAVTLGAALMNLLLAAHGLGEDEQAVCFVAIGTARAASHRARGQAADHLGEWITSAGN